MRAVISPHLDDAVLSCGQWLAESQAPVVTVFAGVPNHGGLTAYDAGCGFHTSNEAMLKRKAEDSAALAALHCRRLHLPLLDLQYRTEPISVDVLAATIESALADVAGVGILAPAGVQHPDHRLVAKASRLLGHQGIPVWVYEELPYRVAYPESMTAALQVWRDDGFVLVEDFLGAGGLEAKERAVACYASQSFDPHMPFVPERFWQARWSG